MFIKHLRNVLLFGLGKVSANFFLKTLVKKTLRLDDQENYVLGNFNGLNHAFKKTRSTRTTEA